MSEGLAPPQKPPEPDTPPTTVAGRLDLLHRAGGISVPVATAVLAFAIGGLVVLATGHNPFLAYRDIFQGAGLNWLRTPGTSTPPTRRRTTSPRRSSRRRP